MKTQTIDLSKHYNSSLDENIHDKPGNDLKAVPHGLCELAGVPFDIGGLIQLSGNISKEKAGIDYPNQIEGIVINQKAEKLQFLHCASWHDVAGTKIGEYRIHYENNHAEIIPIVYQKDVVDWWLTSEDVSPTESKMAWRGSNERTRGRGYSIQLYQSTWINPFPEIEITTMDFISDGKDSAPFLMALTTN
jgi:hypothetical protein